MLKKIRERYVPNIIVDICVYQQKFKVCFSKFIDKVIKYNKNNQFFKNEITRGQAQNHSNIK